MLADKVISAYKRGIDVTTIAESLDVSLPTIYKILKDNDIRLRTKKLMDGTIELICRMHSARRRNRDICNVTGLTRQRVSYLIKKYCT